MNISVWSALSLNQLSIILNAFHALKIPTIVQKNKNVFHVLHLISGILQHNNAKVVQIISIITQQLKVASPAHKIQYTSKMKIFAKLVLQAILLVKMVSVEHVSQEVIFLKWQKSVLFAMIFIFGTNHQLNVNLALQIKSIMKDKKFVFVLSLTPFKVLDIAISVRVDIILIMLLNPASNVMRGLIIIKLLTNVLLKK